MLPNTRTLKQIVVAILMGAALAVGPVALVSPVAFAQKAVLELTVAEQAMVDDNPALKELGETSVDALRLALDMIATALKEERTGRGGLSGLEREDVEILGRNPALLQVWQSSPEASADLLALIRTAAGSGKSQK